MVVFISCCADCITEQFEGLTNDTVYFMTTLNQTLTCFEKYKQVRNARGDDVRCESMIRMNVLL